MSVLGKLDMTGMPQWLVDHSVSVVRVRITGIPASNVSPWHPNDSLFQPGIAEQGCLTGSWL